MRREFLEQKAYFEWVEIMKKQDFRYNMICSSQNGAHLANGAKTFFALKAGGFSKGFPDIGIFVPAGVHHGAFIEMKVKPNKLSKDQKWWLESLKKFGYCTTVAWSADQAMDLTEMYFKFKD